MPDRNHALQVVSRTGSSHTQAPRIGRLAVCALSLTLLAPAAGARAQTDAGQASSAPKIILAPEREKDSHGRGPDLASMLAESLTAMLKESGRFRPFAYNIKHPSVNRAILEHRLSAADLEEPMRPEGLHRLGEALDAPFVLAFRPVLGKSGMKTEAHFEESVEPGRWRSLVSEQIDVAAPAKRHLTTKEFVQLTVYRIAERMNIPYTLPEAIRNLTGPNGEAIAGKKRGAGRGRAEATTQGAPANTASTQGAPANSANAEETAPVPAASPAPVGKAPSSPASQPPPSGSPSAQGAQTGRSQTPPPASASQAHPAPAGSTAHTDTAPPPLPDVSRATAEATLAPAAQPETKQEKIDEEALAERFRQQGDLANEISSLRHAINLRPLDAGLRQQLIEAYQARQMGQQALAETERAIQVAPDDSRLHRLYGDLLRQRDAAAPEHRGLSDAVLREYAAAVRLDPTDASAEVALGDAEISDNRYADALKTYREAAQRDPKSPLPHRRMAIMLAQTASSDPDRYAASADEFRQARALTQPNDTAALLEQYAAMIQVIHTRLTEYLEELQNTYQANKIGQRTDLKDMDGAVADMRTRAEKLSAFLDQIPPAGGQDITHAHYQQATAFILQALSLFRDYLHGRDATAEDAMTTARVNAHREMTAASTHLTAAVQREKDNSAPAGPASSPSSTEHNP
jgi:tetratricopeptide (TPR) repeat protein